MCVWVVIGELLRAFVGKLHFYYNLLVLRIRRGIPSSAFHTHACYITEGEALRLCKSLVTWVCGFTHATVLVLVAVHVCATAITFIFNALNQSSYGTINQMAMHSKLFRYACVSIFCCSRTALSIYFISNFPNPFYYIFGMLLHCAYRLCRSLAACVRVFSWFCFKPALSASTAYFLIEFFVLCWCHKFPEHQLFLKCCFTLFCCDLEGHTTYKYTSNGLGGTVFPTHAQVPLKSYGTATV